jgi:hypothetical protein
MTYPSAPKDKFFEKVIDPYLAEVLQHLKPLRCVRGCCTSMMLRGQRGPEAWRQGSKQCSSKSSSANGDLEATVLQQRAERGGGKAFTERTYHSTGDEYKFHVSKNRRPKLRPKTETKITIKKKIKNLNATSAS